MQVVIQQNSTCSGWIDTCDLIQAQDLDVFDEQGNPAHELYLDVLEEARADRAHLGTSLNEFTITFMHMFILVV
jgi:hypothetical protein